MHTHRHIHTQADTGRNRLTHAETGIHMQTQTDSDRHWQTQTDSGRHMHTHMHIGVRANIHLGGQTEFCPNGERKLFVTLPCQGEHNNNELLQSLFFDVRRVVGPMNVSFVTPPETYLSQLRGVNQTCIVFCPNNVDSLPELMSTNCPNWGGQLPPAPPPAPYAYAYTGRHMQTHVATCIHRQTHAYTCRHRHTHADTVCVGLADRHRLTHADTGRLKQTQTDTRRHMQTDTGTHRTHVQTKVDTGGHMQTQADTYSHRQTQADTCIHMQTQAGTYIHMRTHADTVIQSTDTDRHTQTQCHVDRRGHMYAGRQRQTQADTGIGRH